MIIKWTVSPYSKPARKEYCNETKHFYMHARGRGRDAKDSTYVRYFDSEQEALEYIRQREENKLEQKRIDQIKSAGVDLLEALERCELLLRSKRHACEDSNLCRVLDSHISQSRSAIAKARGEA